MGFIKNARKNKIVNVIVDVFDWYRKLASDTRKPANEGTKLHTTARRKGNFSVNSISTFSFLRVWVVSAPFLPVHPENVKLIQNIVFCKYLDQTNITNAYVSEHGNVTHKRFIWGCLRYPVWRKISKQGEMTWITSTLLVCLVPRILLDDN